MSNWIEGKVVANRHWTEHLYSLSVEAAIEPFKAGQFGRLALEIDGEQVYRPYSFVNPPGAALLEFYSITVPGGPLSNALIKLAPGDRLWIAPKGYGLMTLDQIPDADTLWLVSTGTGIGPFLSISRSPDTWERFRNVVLVHGVRHAAELSYAETLEEIGRQHPDAFHCVRFVSRESVDGCMGGRIPAAIDDRSLEQRVGLALEAETSQVMICGNPAMVDDVVAVLESRQMRRNKRNQPGHITVEAYWKQ